MKLRRLLYPLLASSFLLAGCAEIRDFTVAPRTIFPGESVIASWDVSVDQTTLQASPPLDQLGAKPQQGQQRFSPTSNTHFTLSANALFKSVRREWDVVVVPQPLSASFGEKAICTQDVPTVSFEIADEHVSSQSRVAVVKNPKTVFII